MLELTTSLAKWRVSHASVNRVASVAKEPMARRLTVHKVIESVLDRSDVQGSGIADTSLSLPIGIPYSNEKTRSPPRKHDITTRTFPASALKSNNTY